MKLKQLQEAKYYQQDDFKDVILGLGALITDYHHAEMYEELQKALADELSQFNLSDKDLTEIILRYADASDGWSKSDLYEIQSAARSIGRDVLPNAAIKQSDLPAEADEEWMF